MPSAVWDIDTEDGALVRPLRYVTGSDAVRVLAWMALRTELGTYVFDTGEGLDHERMLRGDTSDAERVALVRDVVLAVDGVAEILEEPEVTTSDDGASVSVRVRARTIYQDEIEVSL